VGHVRWLHVSENTNLTSPKHLVYVTFIYKITNLKAVIKVAVLPHCNEFNRCTLGEYLCASYGSGPFYHLQCGFESLSGHDVCTSIVGMLYRMGDCSGPITRPGRETCSKDSLCVNSESKQNRGLMESKETEKKREQGYLEASEFQI